MTASEKVAVTVNTPEWGSLALEVRATVGAVASKVAIDFVAAMFALLAASCATFAAISIDRLPVPLGVMSAVYVLPSTETKLLAPPFDTVISVISNPITSSENSKVAENGEVETLVGTFCTATVGATVSGCTV